MLRARRLSPLITARRQWHGLRDFDLNKQITGSGSSRIQHSHARGGMDSPGLLTSSSYGSAFPLLEWQRAAIAVSSALGALRNPARADLVAALGETTGINAFRRMLQRMRESEEGRALLVEKPRVTAATTALAGECGPDTFGAAYTEFMGVRKFSADDRPPVLFIADPELAYVAARAREVHDFWHVLFNCPTTVTGELALKMVEFVQTGMPMCALSILGGPVRLSPARRQILIAQYFPWAAKAGLQCADLMSIRYESHFKENIQDLRNRWRIMPAPSV